MGLIIEAIKNFSFPEDSPYQIENYEILEPNTASIDHLLDYRTQGIKINPEMHVLLDVQLNGSEMQDTYNMLWTAELKRSGKFSYALWNGEESKRRFMSTADMIDLQKPEVAYWLLGHDALGYLKNQVNSFQKSAETELNLQQEGYIPPREIDFPLLLQSLERHSHLRETVKGIDCLKLN